MYNNSSSIF